jgi:phosphopantothenoylcysteine decarboxylase/phosphopantothenate--cysteine ligase
VDLALWADAMVIAPATANTISKMANGICDNLLMGVYLSARCPVYIAPAMDEDMWKHPSTKANLAKLSEFGNTIIPVNHGELASGLTGEGRMAEPEAIVEFLEYDFLKASRPAKLPGKKILITAGPTYEAIDPVRFIGNHSSGKMGIALAEKAQALGAQVTLVLGPSKEPVNPAIKTIRVNSARDMYAACKKEFAQTDICIFAAAVADYTPKNTAGQKIKKSDAEFSLVLKKNVDIAAEFGSVKKVGQVSIGFALETQDELKHAREKLKKKNFDLVVLNSINDKGAGFRHDTNKISIVGKNNKLTKFGLKSKSDVAMDILTAIENIL